MVLISGGVGDFVVRLETVVASRGPGRQLDTGDDIRVPRAQ